MKSTEIKPIDNAATRIGPRVDRVPPPLIWLTFFLIAGLAALIVDLWLRPVSDGPEAQAIGLTPSVVSSAPAVLPPTPSTITPTPLPAAKVDLAEQTLPACVPPDDWGIHVVQAGNTLYSLARRYNTGLDTLMQVNCLNTHTIFAGQRIYVPAPPASPTIATSLGRYRQAPNSEARPGASATPMDGMAAVPTVHPTLTPQPAFPITIPDRYLNIVLLGSDRRPRSGAWRTDSMIVVSVDTSNNMVRLLSIPRDLWVYIPGHGYNRINTADLWGELAKSGTGPERVKQTIHHNLGIPIHYYVRVDFKGFMQIIDTVGGIDVDVDCPLSDIKLSAGMHHMTGQQALRYSRSRYSTNDFDRGRRQRKVLMALWDQALTLQLIPKLPQLWWTMSNSFQTDLSLDQVINLAYVGVQLEPQDILSQAIGPSHVQSWMTPQGASVLLPSHEKIRSMLEEFYAPVDPIRRDDTDKKSVRVLNGSPRRDADQLAAAALRWAGFRMMAAGLADHQNYTQTQITVHGGDTAAAGQIAQQLRVPGAMIREQPDPASPVDFEVILGSDYNPCQR